jgi:hypothetical protein
VIEYLLSPSQKLESERQRGVDLRRKLDIGIEKWEELARRRAQSNETEV